LPDLNLESINTSTELFGKKLAAPILISSMTGGTDRAEIINQRLAKAAQTKKIALGVGSQRAAIEDTEQAKSFSVRKSAPDALIFANLGAVQLNYGYGIDQCLQAVDMVKADALFLHLNALQEALQPEGDTNFAGLLKKIEKVCQKLPVPVIVKEVGWGISGDTARRLADVGVHGIDVAGAGGTSWSQVEMYRMIDLSRARTAAAFRNWGIPTADAIRQVRKKAPELTVFASGGLRDGVDIAKCIALGASLSGLAGPFLKAAVESEEDVLAVVDELIDTLRICMFAAGRANIKALKNTPLVER
jgi:isopentenyl-diphosphate Delta-isomerase